MLRLMPAAGPARDPANGVLPQHLNKPKQKLGPCAYGLRANTIEWNRLQPYGVSSPMAPTLRE